MGCLAWFDGRGALLVLEIFVPESEARIDVNGLDKPLTNDGVSC